MDKKQTNLPTNNESMPNPIPTQTKTKVRAKILVPLVVVTALILGFGGLVVLNAFVPTNPLADKTKIITNPLADIVRLPVFYEINLKDAFKEPSESDSYIIYNDERKDKGLRLSAGEFINKVDTPEGNPFSSPKALLSSPWCEKFTITEFQEYIQLDVSNFFLSSNNKIDEEAKIEEKTINFTNLHENKIYPKLKFHFTAKLFQEIEKQMKEHNKSQEEAIKNIIGEKLTDPNLSEEKKTELKKYLESLANITISLESLADQKISENNGKIAELEKKIQDKEKKYQEEIDKFIKENKELEKELQTADYYDTKNLESKIAENKQKITKLENEKKNNPEIKSYKSEAEELKKENEKLEKQKSLKVTENGLSAYFVLDIFLPHLIGVRYQYDPRYMLVSNGEIFPLTPGETGLKAKLCDNVETNEIKVKIPQKGFKDFEPKKDNQIGAYNAGFLIGKGQSQPILQNKINKILEKNYIVKATLNTETLHHNFANGEMEIFLSPDGGRTWIVPNEQKPIINHPGKQPQTENPYLSKKDTFTYNFEEKLEPKDLRMIVIAQNATETGARVKNANWEAEIEKVKGKKLPTLEKENPNVMTASGYSFQQALFLHPKEETKLKIDNKLLSDFDLLSKFDGGIIQKTEKIDTTAAVKPFYTQIAFIEGEEKAKETKGISEYENIIKTTKDLQYQINNLKKENEANLEKIDITKTDIPFTDPSPIDIIDNIKQNIALLAQTLPEASNKIQNLKSQVSSLENTYSTVVTRGVLDKNTAGQLDQQLIQIEDGLNSLQTDLQKKVSPTSSSNSLPFVFFRNTVIPEAKAQTLAVNDIGKFEMPKPMISTEKIEFDAYPIFSAVVLSYSTPILNEAAISFTTKAKPVIIEPPPPPEGDLNISPLIWHRGHSRVVSKWKFTQGADNNLDPANISFKYGEKENEINKGAKVYKDKNDGKYYVVLRQLKGGEFSDKNNGGYKSGRFPYFYQVSAAGKTTETKTFQTLNRMQTIGYYYTLVLDRDYLKDQSEANLAKWFAPESEFGGKKVKDLEQGGPGFFYKPPKDKEPLTLPGIKFTMINDRMVQEFNNRLADLQKKEKIKKAIEHLYRVVHDRIYDEDLGKFFDAKGVDYWASRTDEKIAGKDVIDIFGVKFALSVSREYQEELFGALGVTEAKQELAYQIVLKRGADQEGAKYLGANFSLAKEMRKHLAQSSEYNSRLAEIEKNLGRQAMIFEIYETLYGRAGDIKGIEYWDKTGLPLDILKQKFLTSKEFTEVIKD